jgi:hypothetical protein
MRDLENSVSQVIACMGTPATARNILASEPLYRLGGAADLVMLACDTAVALIFYDLLKPVSRSLSLLAAFFRLIHVAIMAVSSLNHFAPVSGVFDYAGLSRELALWLLFMLPSAHFKDVGVRIASFLDSPPHLFPCLRFAVHLTVPNAKLGAERIATPYW